MPPRSARTRPSTAAGNVLANDTDVDAGDTQTVTAVNGAAGNVGVTVAGTYGTLTLNANGSYTYTLTTPRPIVQALRAGQSVTDTFTYATADGPAATNTANLTVTITGTNDAPVAIADTAAVQRGRDPRPPPATCSPTTPTWTPATPRP